MKILIAIPTYETIKPACFKAIYGLQRAGHILLFDYVKGYDCARARNDIAQEALKGEFDAVLMVDSDTVLPPDALAHLTEPPADICLGIYPRKRSRTGQSEIFRLGSKDFTQANNIPMAELKATSDRIKIKGGGLGCALIRTDVFRKLPAPWFMYVTYPNGDCLSEDLYFCNNARAAGFNIEADPRVQCGHVYDETHY